MGKWVHRLSNIRPEQELADCATCGPGVAVYYRPGRDLWVCRTSREGWEKQRQRDPASKAWGTRASKLKKKFGLTVTEYDEMAAAQGGVCAICLGPEPLSGRRLAVDHCHTSGAIRGLLCRRCNQVLGSMQDDPELLLRAAQYLESSA